MSSFLPRMMTGRDDDDGSDDDSYRLLRGGVVDLREEGTLVHVAHRDLLLRVRAHAHDDETAAALRLAAPQLNDRAQLRRFREQLARSNYRRPLFRNYLEPFELGVTQRSAASGGRCEAVCGLTPLPALRLSVVLLSALPLPPPLQDTSRPRQSHTAAILSRYLCCASLSALLRWDVGTTPHHAMVIASFLRGRAKW